MLDTDNQMSDKRWSETWMFSEGELLQMLTSLLHLDS